MGEHTETAIQFTEMPSDRDWVLARRGVIRRFIRNGRESSADTFPTLEPESTLRAEIEALRAVVRWFHDNVELDHDEIVALHVGLYDRDPDVAEVIDRALDSGS